MAKYLILGLLAFCAALFLACWVLGKRLKGESAKNAQLQKDLDKARTAERFAETKEKILREVFEDAKEQTEGLRAGTSAERFDAADAILRNQKG